MLVVLTLKFKYKINAKIKKDDDSEFCLIKKTTCLNFNTPYNDWYIIPTITVSFNNGVSITFYWFNITYSSFWTVVTFEDENKYVEFIQFKNNNK